MGVIIEFTTELVVVILGGDETVSGVDCREKIE